MGQPRLIHDPCNTVIQHREGGIVNQIHVNENDYVVAGTPLISLDSTRNETVLQSIVHQLKAMNAKRARLIAERDGLTEIGFGHLGDDVLSDESTSILQTHQSQLHVAKRASLNRKKEQLVDQIDQLERKIDGLKMQSAAKEIELELLEEEILDTSTLREKELVAKRRLLELKREQARIRGDSGEINSTIAQTKEIVSEKRVQIIQVEEDFLTETLEFLEQVEVQIAQLKEQKKAAKDVLVRDVIVSPYAGVVHELGISSTGSVVTGGDVLLEIVPESDQLTVEVRVANKSIDSLFGQDYASVRFPGVDQRTTPTLNGTVKSISPDMIYDERTRVGYYKVRVTIDAKETETLSGKSLVPGMPVEVFVETGARTILSYLIKPLADQAVYALRES